ncbi:MAG: hypothetical protein ABIO70_05185 [Pseudomonadota bacterium]
MKRILPVLAALALMIPSAALAKKKGGGNKQGGEGRELVFKKGTMELGGSATLDFYSWDGASSWDITIAPAGGYFVQKRLEIVGQVYLQKIKDVDDLGWGIDGGARYYFDMKPNWAYIGALAGFANGGTLEGFGVGGIIIPLSKNVGLDLGGQIGIEKYKDVDAMGVWVSAGYLGVHGYFRQ